MKVKELQKLLSECDPESEVILQKDPEGNGYSPLYGVDNEYEINKLPILLWLCREGRRDY